MHETVIALERCLSSVAYFFRIFAFGLPCDISKSHGEAFLGLHLLLLSQGVRALRQEKPALTSKLLLPDAFLASTVDWRRRKKATQATPGIAPSLAVVAVAGGSHLRADVGIKIRRGR